MIRLVHIHGINNESGSSHVIRDVWDEALNAGFKKSGVPLIDTNQIECAYYGELLEEQTRLWFSHKRSGDSTTRSSKTVEQHRSSLM